MSRRKKKKYKAGGNEKLLIQLQALTAKPCSDREMATSLLRWYLSNQYWSPKQVSLVRSLVYRNKDKPPEKALKYHLYAIGDGECVKLGVSTNIGNRLNSMQTGHPKKLRVLWKFYIGRERKPAYSAEKKLHRLCKKHKLRGEWFKGECMTVVNQFSLKEKMNMVNEQECHDLALLENSPI